MELLKYNTDLIIREIKPIEYFFLEEMLYQAIFMPDERIKLPRSIINEPKLRIYIEDFGKKEDLCLVAEQNGVLLGAVWIRLFNSKNMGYGYVDDKTPEISIAVMKEHRGKGIGTKLFEEMINKIKDRKFEKVSLSVDKDNYAYKLYKKFGFSNYREAEKSIVMLREMGGKIK